MKKSKKLLIFLCLISGVIFLLAGFYLTSRTSEFKKNGIETQAEIVLIEKDYDTDGEEKITVYVKYTVENTTYTRKLDYYSFTLHEGDIITILYLPDTPGKITYPKFNTVPQTLFFVGPSLTTSWHLPSVSIFNSNYFARFCIKNIAPPFRSVKSPLCIN